jgi:outer membrane protein assembly factor BamB
MAPKLADDEIILSNAYGDVGILDRNTLGLKWVRTLEQHLSSNPGISRELVLVGTIKAKLVAFDRTNGQERWRSRLSSEMLAAPVAADGVVIAQCVDGHVQAFTADTGKPLWNYNHTTPALTLRGTAEPLVVGKNVVAAFADGKVVAFDIKTGKQQWSTTIASPRGRSELERLVDIDGLFQNRNGVVYVTSFQGNIVALSAQDGRNIWTRNMSSYTGLVLGDEQLFVTDEESHVWSLDTRTGATLWRQDKLLGRELSAPAYLNNRVAVADYAGYVHWLSADDGSFLARSSMEKAWHKFEYDWPEEMGPLEKPPLRSVTTPPLAWGASLLVRDNTGTLAAFHVTPRTANPTANEP